MSTLIDRQTQGVALERTETAGFASLPAENTAEAMRARRDAQRAAAAAGAAAGLDEYASTAAGLAATDEGDTFWVDNGDGTGQAYRHDAGPAATALPQSFILDPGGPGIAALLGERDTASVQAKLDALRASGIDMIEFTPGGAIPTQTALGRPVGFRENGPDGTNQIIIDADGFMTNDAVNNPTGRGGAYIVADAGGPARYQSMEFRIVGGGSTRNSVGLMMPWTADITAGAYAVPPTSSHAGYGLSAWSITKYEVTNDPSPPNIGSGAYPFGWLTEGQTYTLESAIVDGKLYRFLDGYLLAIVEDADLETLTGNFPGWETFKLNETDNEPGIRRLTFSSSERVAREVRDRYLRNQRLEGGASASSAYSIIDDFMGGTTTTGNVGERGWGFNNYTVAIAESVADHPGMYALNTSAVNGTVHSLFMGGSNLHRTIRMPDFSEAEFVFNENAAGITDHDIRVGLFSDMSTATGSNGIYLEKLAADTNYHFVGRIGGFETRIDTGVAGGTTDWLTLRIHKITSTRFGCSIKINGGAEALVAELDDDTDYVPVGNPLMPGVMSVISGATIRRLNIDYFRLAIEATAR